MSDTPVSTSPSPTRFDWCEIEQRTTRSTAQHISKAPIGTTRVNGPVELVTLLGDTYVELPDGTFVPNHRVLRLGPVTS